QFGRFSTRTTGDSDFPERFSPKWGLDVQPHLYQSDDPQSVQPEREAVSRRPGISASYYAQRQHSLTAGDQGPDMSQKPVHETTRGGSEIYIPMFGRSGALRLTADAIVKQSRLFSRRVLPPQGVFLPHYSTAAAGTRFATDLIDTTKMEKNPYLRKNNHRLSLLNERGQERHACKDI